MPPALSDNESSDRSEIGTPARKTRKASIKSASDSTTGDDDILNGQQPVSDGSEDEEEDLDEDIFIVEKINKHIIDEDGSLKFQVKWEGYESKKDLTWEPEENLKESAGEVLDEYYAKLGGREAIFDETEKASKTKKRRRATTSTAANATTKRSRRNGQHPAEATPPATLAAISHKWSPPAGSWEDDIETIDACEDEGSGRLVVYLIWKNGQKTKHDTSTIYKKCPQKMLQFYERHVKIVRDEAKEQADEMET